MLNARQAGSVKRYLTVLLSLPLLGVYRPAPPVHEFHVSYARLAVEGGTAVLQIRFFRDDLEAALGPRAGVSALRLSASPEIDRIFSEYLAEKFQLVADGDSLPGTIIGSGEDTIDREPAWWYLVRYSSPHRIGEFQIRNVLLLETFEDQTTILRVLRLPDQTPVSVTFSAELVQAEF